MDSVFTDIKKYPNDLIEVHFTGLTEESWRSLFDWANKDRVKRLFDQWGVIWEGHLDIEAYLDETESYMFNFDMDHSGREYTFLLISLTEATIDIDQEEDLVTERDLKQVITDCTELAEILRCPTFHMCPESHTEYIVYQWSAAHQGEN